MSDELGIQAWVTKRTFLAAQVCNTIVTELHTAKGVSPAEEVANAMTALLGAPYTDVDVRMLMGSSANPEETAALLLVSDAVKRVTAGPVPNVDSQIIVSEEEAVWDGYVASFFADRAAYVAECEDLVRTFTAALAALPPVVEGADLTEAVAFPDMPGQHPAVNKFINDLLAHFTIKPGTVMIPSAEIWLLAKYIVVRTIEREEGVVITVPTPKGVIVLNATPV